MIFYNIYAGKTVATKRGSVHAYPYHSSNPKGPLKNARHHVECGNLAMNTNLTVSYYIKNLYISHGCNL